MFKNKKNELNVGIVGLGNVAGAHINAFKNVKGAKVVAVCSKRLHKEAELERKYGVRLKVFSNYEYMLADPDIHIIDICSQHAYHTVQAIAAAKAKKHIIVEKPISLTFKDAIKIQKVIIESDVNVCVCFECRYSDHFSMIRSVIDNGLLGDVHYGEVDYFHGIGPRYNQYSWNIKKETGGSSLLTAGCHALDALLFFIDGTVEEVTSYSVKSKGEKFSSYEYDTTCTTILKFYDTRKIAKVTSCIDCIQPYYFHIHLIGSEGSLLDNKFCSNKLNGMDKNKWSTLGTTLVDSGDVNSHPYAPQFQSFVQSIENGRKMPLTDFDTAFNTHKIIFAADISAKERRPVKLSELD